MNESFSIQDFTSLPDEHRRCVNNFLNRVGSNLFCNMDPKKVFQNCYDMKVRGFFGTIKKKNAEEEQNVSGIMYGEYQGVAYIAFFLTLKAKKGLGSKVLLQLEKTLLAKGITCLVVLATVDSENFYKKRDFAKLDKPPLIGHSAYGKRLKEKIKKNASILRLFPSCVILFKILSENCFTKFVSSSRINFDFMTAEHAAVIRSVEEPMNKLDWRYTYTRRHKK